MPDPVGGDDSEDGEDDRVDGEDDRVDGEDDRVDGEDDRVDGGDLGTPAGAGGEDGGSRPDGQTGDDDESLPEAVVEEAERLTRLARRATDPDEAAAYRSERADLLAEHGYAAHVRSGSGASPSVGPTPGSDDAGQGSGDALVCLPAAWLVDGDVDPERVADVERAVEVPLSGAGDPDDWEEVAASNRAVATAVRDAHGPVHGANAGAFAEYVSNHYAKPLSSVTAPELRHFREEYYRRNVWPSEEQAEALQRSLELVFEELSVPQPGE